MPTGKKERGAYWLKGKGCILVKREKGAYWLKGKRVPTGKRERGAYWQEGKGCILARGKGVHTGKRQVMRGLAKQNSQCYVCAVWQRKVPR